MFTKSKGMGESLIELVSIPDDGAGDGDRVIMGLSSCLKESALRHFLSRECLGRLDIGKLDPLNNLLTSVSIDNGRTKK